MHTHSNASRQTRKKRQERGTYRPFISEHKDQVCLPSFFLFIETDREKEKEGKKKGRAGTI